jgi:hypothetical protein
VRREVTSTVEGRSTTRTLWIHTTTGEALQFSDEPHVVGSLEDATLQVKTKLTFLSFELTFLSSQPQLQARESCMPCMHAICEGNLVISTRVSPD